MYYLHKTNANCHTSRPSNTKPTVRSLLAAARQTIDPPDTVTDLANRPSLTIKTSLT